MEIDLLIETPKGIIGIEIKSRDEAKSSDTGNLETLGKALGKEWLGGIVVNRGNTINQLSKTVWVIPSHRLFT
jgi:hypothetical protein